MVDDRRDTVVVEKERRSPLGWIIGLIVLLILLALFFSYGGFGMFGGDATTPDSINVQTPDTVNVQPGTGQ